MSHICVDIADPANFTAPAWADTVQGYIGERVPIKTPTPHIWTVMDWQRFGKRKKYPMFVGTPAVGASGNPLVEAFECMESLYSIGCAPGHVVGLDMEMAINPGYVNKFYDVLHTFGYFVWVYGSASTIYKNPQCDGYDVADWTGQQHFATPPANSAVRATQYANGTQSGIGADLRVIRPWQWRYRLWS